MANERLTEEIVREEIRKYDPLTYGKIQSWEQIIDHKDIAKLLKTASKADSGKPGFPEFVIRFIERPEFVIVIECKADISDHCSKNAPFNPKKYCIDGVKHYARFLSEKFNVLAVAVSGIKKNNLAVNYFFHYKGEQSSYEYNSHGPSILKIDGFMDIYLNQTQTHRQDYELLLSFSKELNERLNKFKIKTGDRSLLIAAILTALDDPAFKDSYEKQGNSKVLLNTIKTTAISKVENRVRNIMKRNLAPAYSFMDATNKLLDEDNLISIVRDIDKSINSFKKTHEYYDLLGQMYIQFLKYSNSDKSLGIILTPPHLTDLAVGFTNVGIGDVVLDNCAGTGGFLISAMRKMIELSEGNKDEQKRIKQSGLIGVEIDSTIANLLCCNMYIHDDGKSNILLDDSLKGTVIEEIKKMKPTIGLLNPPFKKQGNKEEFEFVLSNLESLRPNSKCAAILPMQCALASKGERLALKKAIMKKHTVDAVVSLPNNAFHQTAGTITCMMVFTAHKPHPKNGKVWLALAKNDGYVVKKHIGRVDINDKWGSIKEKWVSSFHNREETTGFSVMRKLKPNEEWCSEPHIRKSIDELKSSDFQKSIRQFVSFLLANEKIDSVINSPVLNENINLNDRKWSWFKVSNILDVSLGPYTEKVFLQEGNTPYITRTAQNNGVDCFGSHNEIYNGNCITIGAEGVVAFYQMENFLKGNKINVIRHARMNPRIGMFLITIFNFVHVGIFNYGYALVMKRLNSSMVPLPILMRGGGRESRLELYGKIYRTIQI